MMLEKRRHSNENGGLLRCMLTALQKGDFLTRLSFLWMGSGCLFRGQIGRGLLYLASQILFILYFVLFGWPYLAKFPTLGTQTQYRVFDEENGIYRILPGDNSMEILLFSVVTLAAIALFLRLYAGSVRAAWDTQQIKCKGGKLATFREDIRALFDQRYHTLLLTAPVILVFIFTVLPLVFMVLIAFTNFDKSHQPPGNLFTWVGLQNFVDLFSGSGQTSTTFFRLFGWTLTWAVFATFLNYLLGMVVALMINKRSIRFKGLWRTLFVIPIAVPQFVTLLLMSQLLSAEGTGGAINVLLQQMGIIQTPIPFLSDGTLAKITVIVVNVWIGIPYTILITSGILMNIPEDMYESARIDGAGPLRTFFSITLPYMMFITTPYLITQFVGNFNNFNVIYLLTGGGPLSLDYYQAGKTDLLVTWLYKQTVDQQNYNLASAIGIIVFLVSAGLSLLVYNSSASARKEEQFQ